MLNVIGGVQSERQQCREDPPTEYSRSRLNTKHEVAHDMGCLTHLEVGGDGEVHLERGARDGLHVGAQLNPRELVDQPAVGPARVVGELASSCSSHAARPRSQTKSHL
jgi:hypothetical protein